MGSAFECDRCKQLFKGYPYRKMKTYSADNRGNVKYQEFCKDCFRTIMNVIEDYSDKKSKNQR